mmetsp:Transcript_139364/g.259889  ORF Transcript_139364/g.259889 Transcript_139364/m.259889 type:complete len:107 (+) Transcript_139364:144-464(+)
MGCAIAGCLEFTMVGAFPERGDAMPEDLGDEAAALLLPAPILALVEGGGAAIRTGEDPLVSPECLTLRTELALGELVPCPTLALLERQGVTPEPFSSVLIAKPPRE